MPASRLLACCALALILPFAAARAAVAPAPVPAPEASAPSRQEVVPEAEDQDLREQADQAGLQLLDTVVVSGVQPGPGLWKVSRDGKVMWVLGTLGPLPKRMEWNSAEVEAKVATSGVVLLPPTVELEAKGVAMGGIFLVPRLMRARNNPGKERLQDVLPPEDYARWQALKAVYLPRDGGVEKRRPILAALDLLDAALDQNDLSWRDVVMRVVRRAAKDHDVPVERPSVNLVVEDAKAAVKEFADSPVNDLDCFRKTLDQVQNDLDTLATRANAWALGEVAMLSELPYTDNAKACTEAVLSTSLAQRSGFGDLPARVKEAWMQAAQTALATHEESFAVLSMARVVGPGGYLAELEKLGYTVEAPLP
jgi:uncharacterized protein YbaP (TraB family)